MDFRNVGYILQFEGLNANEALGLYWIRAFNHQVGLCTSRIKTVQFRNAGARDQQLTKEVSI